MYDIASLEALIGRLEREAAREDLPLTLRRLAAIGAERCHQLLEAAVTDNALAIEEIVEGTINEKTGRHRPDGIRQVLPYWARGVVLLEELFAYIEIDESVDPPAVRPMWEQIPPKRRKAVASLASELVDLHRPRGRGGRTPKLPNSSDAEPGNPHTGDPSG